MTEALITSITFEKATLAHQKVIFEWLAEPHMQEFWDNSQEHKDDILNFMHGKPQVYFYGTTRYWIGLIHQQPFCFLLTDQVIDHQEDISASHQSYLSTTGHTIAIDFGIGNKDFLGKGLAAPTLKKFISFYKEQVDPLVSIFFIDPDEKNTRAQHVYEKAGFKRAGSYEAKMGAFKGQTSHLMVQKI
jgi:RimJ/RimL family protein N-acetyltransferase